MIDCLQEVNFDQVILCPSSPSQQEKMVKSRAVTAMQCFNQPTHSDKAPPRATRRGQTLTSRCDIAHSLTRGPHRKELHQINKVRFPCNKKCVHSLIKTGRTAPFLVFFKSFISFLVSDEMPTTTESLNMAVTPR